MRAPTRGPTRARFRPDVRSAVLGVLTLAVAQTGLLTASAAPVEAQILPDSPRMLGVLPERGLGVYWLRPSALPGDGSGALVTLRPGFLPEGVRLRLGGGTGAGDTEAGFAGIDVQIPLAGEERGAEDSSDPAGPARVAWTTGLAASHGEWTVVTLPVGVMAGVVWSEGAVTLAPWLSVGVGFDLQLGEAAPDEEFEVRPAAELGMDMAFDRGRRVLLRGGVSLGDRSALAVGLVIR